MLYSSYLCEVKKSQFPLQRALRHLTYFFSETDAMIDPSTLHLLSEQQKIETPTFGPDIIIVCLPQDAITTVDQLARIHSISEPDLMDE